MSRTKEKNQNSSSAMVRIDGPGQAKLHLNLLRWKLFGWKIEYTDNSVKLIKGSVSNG